MIRGERCEHNLDHRPEAVLVYIGGGQVYQHYCRELEESGYASMLAAERIAEPAAL
jgi:hypothetical protein